MAKKTTVKRTGRDSDYVIVRAGRDSDQFMVRLPDGMRQQLARVAERNGRSMNAEIVTALAEYFANQGAKDILQPPAKIEKALKDLEDRLDQKLAERTDELARLIKEKIK